MCRADYGEPSTVQSSKFVKARKEHKCDECWRKIARGETYEYAFFVVDHVAYSHHTCAHCIAARKWLVDNCSGYMYGQVREELDEHAEEYPALARPLNRLAHAMRKKWRASRGGLRPVPSKLPPSIASIAA